MICVADTSRRLHTYNGKAAVGKNPLDHCIAFDGDTAPDPLPGERLGKAVHLVLLNPKRPLVQSSRIDIGCPLTVDYRRPVKDYGIVHPDSIESLLNQRDAWEQRRAAARKLDMIKEKLFERIFKL